MKTINAKTAHYLLFLFTVCPVSLLCSCDWLDTERITPEAALHKRVSDYWETVINGNAEAAFGFFEPKARTDENHIRYIRGMKNFKFLSYEIQNVNIKKESAYVRVKRIIQFTPSMIPVNMKPVDITMNDKWVLIEGKWYIAHIKPKPPFPLNTPQKQRL